MSTENDKVQIRSKYAPLLNRLSDMQGASYYATARGVLSQAESAIVRLEAEVEGLRRQVEEKEAEISTDERLYEELRADFNALRSSIDARVERAIRLTIAKVTPKEHWESLDPWQQNIIVAAVLEQMKGEKE